MSVDRIRLPIDFDTGKLQADIENLNLSDFIYYDVIPLRAPAHLVDPSRLAPPPCDDYADGSWTEWLDSPTLERSTYLSEVIDRFRAHTDVTLVRLLRLEAGAVVKEHTDPTLGLEQQNSVIRLTIPIINPTDVEFYLNDSIVPMRPGECWYLRLSDPHRIVNASPHERINMTIDVRPNDWLRSQLSTT